MNTPELGPRRPQPKKQWKVKLEMEGYGRDGEEITGSALWEEVIVEASTEAEAYEFASNMDFGNRRIANVEDPVEVKE